MNGTRIVARREFLATVRRKSFLVVTFGMPAFLAIYIGIVSIPAILSAKHAHQVRTLGIVNACAALTVPDTLTGAAGPAEGAASGAAAGALAAHVRESHGMAALGPVRFRAFADTAGAREALLAREIAGFYVFPDSYLTSGMLLSYGAKDSPLADKDVEKSALDRLLRKSLLTGQVPGREMERVLKPRVDIRRYELTETGMFSEKTTANSVVPLAVAGGLGFLLMMSIWVSGGTLLQGVAEEKENRVMEVLLSSVTPWELLTGKLLGLGLAGLVPITVWVAVVFLVTMGALPFAVALGGVHIPPLLAVYSLLFFVAGYFLFGSLMVGTGSLGNTARESQQLSMVWTMTSTIPMIMLSNILEEPNGTIARVLSFIPLTAPMTMMFRLGSNAVAWWEPPAALAIVLGTAWLALRASAKLFRIGVLLYGKRVTLPEILRWVRA